jgi:hypothetical protein
MNNLKIGTGLNIEFNIFSEKGIASRAHHQSGV